MKTAGNLVAVFVELTTCVKHCKYNLKCGAVLFGMHSGRDTTTVILDGDGVVLVDVYCDICTEAGHGLVDTVVNHLVYQMVKTSFAYIADVH